MYDPATVATNVTNPKETVIMLVGVRAATESAGLVVYLIEYLSLMLDKMAFETRRGKLLLRINFGRPCCAIGVPYVAQCHLRHGGCDGQIH